MTPKLWPPRTAGAQTLHGRFLQIARARPGREAVAFGTAALTYGELAARAQALAGALRARDVGRGSLVAVHVERGLDMVTAVLAVLIAGAAYLPLDVAAPPIQLERVMREAAPELLLVTGDAPSSAAWRGDAPEHRIGEEGAAPAPCTPEGGVAGPDDLAYVIFTSGSTGRPKGVEVAHRSVLNLLDAARRSPGFASSDVLVALANLAFDVSVVDLFLPLTTGARLVIAGREEALDFGRLATLLERSRCTLMQATPGTWSGLVEAGWRGDRRLRILSGADVLKPELARALLPRGREVWNMYGPTEATVWCVQHRVSAGDDPVPIGRPVQGLQLRVAGPDGREAAAGDEGELLIGGVGLARGYRGAPELTAERFLHRPDGGRLYRTGDLGRRRPDGRLEWRGRLDGLVKVRGYRVELGDVEAALISHPGVAAAAVDAVGEADGSHSLAAFVLPRDPAAPPGASELRRWVRERRPAYCVPQRVAVVDAMPLTAGGKVDRHRLRALQA